MCETSLVPCCPERELMCLTPSPPPPPPPPPSPFPPASSPPPADEYVIPMVSESCCEQQPISAFAYKEMDDVCGTSYCPQAKAPSAVETDWYTAYDTCQAMGARLCHESDLLAAKGTGCNFDAYMVWTQTSCTKQGEPGFLLIKGNLEQTVCRWPQQSAHIGATTSKPTSAITVTTAP
eukprot:scaffold6573_cov350-Prasinococcus_capsulatus_cf.AAC.3